MLEEFIKYVIPIAEDKNLDYRINYPDGIIVRHKDRAVDIYCDGSEITLYYFKSWSNENIAHCDTIDLHNPHSISWILEWIDKLDEN